PPSRRRLRINSRVVRSNPKAPFRHSNAWGASRQVKCWMKPTKVCEAGHEPDHGHAILGLEVHRDDVLYASPASPDGSSHRRKVGTVVHDRNEMRSRGIVRAFLEARERFIEPTSYRGTVDTCFEPDASNAFGEHDIFDPFDRAQLP